MKSEMLKCTIDILQSGIMIIEFDQLRNVTTYVCIPIVGPMQQDVLCFKWNSRRNARDIVESYRKTRAKRNCSQLLIINGPGAD